MIVKALFTAVTAVPQIPNPTPEELATGEKAARMLMDFEPRARRASDADWAKAREQMQSAAKGALLYLALKPGADAMQKKDYATAEAAFQKRCSRIPIAARWPTSWAAAKWRSRRRIPLRFRWECTKLPERLRSIRPRARRADRTQYVIPTSRRSTCSITAAKKVWTSSSSRRGFSHSAGRLPHQEHHRDVREKEAEFEKSNPQLALWMKIKAQLADTNGEQYFQTQLKDAAVPHLRGTLVEAKPACHSKELLVAVPLPVRSSPCTRKSL